MRWKSLIDAAFLAICCVGISACGNPDKGKLVFRPAAGSACTIETSDAVNFTMNLMGMQQSMSMSREVTYAAKVDSVDEQGNVTLTMTYEDISVELPGLDQMFGAMGGGLPGAPGAGQAGRGSESPFSPKRITEALESAKGEQFTVRVSKFGEVLGVEGADAIAKKVGDALMKASGASAGMGVGAGGESFGTDATTAMMKRIFLAAPDKRFNVNDVLELSSTDTSMQLPVTTTAKYTLRERANGVVSLDGTATYAFDLSQGPLQKGLEELKKGPMGEMFKDLRFSATADEGSGSGSIKIFEDSGWVADRLETAQIKGEFSIEGMGAGKFTMPIDVSVKTTVKCFPT